MFLALLFRKNIKQLDDTALLELIRLNDNRAMGVLFERYSFLVLGLCLKYLRNKMEAEDEMMNIFDKLGDKIMRNEILNFKTWLYSVARNECLMKLRKKGVKETDAEKALLAQEDESEDGLNLAILTENKMALLEKALVELNEEQRICIDLFYLKDKSYDEIAQTTNFDLKKVKSYIQNGKRNLKLILENQREFKS